jgi:hypothetical protein
VGASKLKGLNRIVKIRSPIPEGELGLIYFRLKSHIYHSNLNSKYLHYN